MGGRAALLTLLVTAGGSWATVEVMKDVTLGFGEALQHCREESQLTEEKMEEFFHFWSDDFKFEHRELGCAIRCMGRYFNLLTDSHRMHHENTDKFIQSFPNGEVLSKLMVSIIHECEKKFDDEQDHCWRILHVAECFKSTCQQQGVAPTMELLMAEFIMESESQLTEEKMEEFFHFWSDDFKFEHRELGCAIRCMGRYFNLLTDSHRMHHENTDKFIQSFPNGEVLSKLMVSIIHECEKKFDDEQDHCWRILHVAECFKSTCQQQGVAPTMELLMAEFIMESEV